MKLRIQVLLSSLIACFMVPLSFGQTLSQPPAAAPEETAELQPLHLIDTDLSRTDTNATVENTVPSTEPSADPQGKGSGNPSGRAKPTATAPAATTPYVFPTSADMNRYWLEYTIGGPKPYLGATFTASWNQWVSDSPKEWSKTATGWSQRFGSSLLDNGINTTSLVWISRATHLDPRYHRCECAGVKARSFHAMKLVFASYNRSGNLTLAPAKFVAPFTGPAVTRNTIYPDRFGWGDVGTGGAYYFLGGLAWNFVKEFIWNMY